MDPTIRKILESGILAPSGENTQPWKFVLKSNTISIYNIPNRDESLYNWGQRASFLANGAALENIVIASKEFGFNPQITLFPSKDNIDLIANIELIKDNIQKDALFEFIQKRSTNRKKYDLTPLTELEKKEILSTSEKEIKIYLTGNQDDKKILGEVGSSNEIIMLSNQYLHNFFFTHINWTQEEDNNKKIGFFIDTLELPIPAKFLFRIIKNWKITNLLRKVGFHKMVGKQNAETNSAAAAFGIITIPNMDKENFVNAGRILEKMWLTITKLNLNMQPLTGILFFMYKIIANETDKFNNEQINIIKTTYKNIKSIFGIKENEIVAFMFRVGHGEKPTARSTRFKVEEVTQII